MSEGGREGGREGGEARRREGCCVSSVIVRPNYSLSPFDTQFHPIKDNW